MTLRGPVVLAMLLAAVRVSAATPQEQVEARRKANPKVIVHVITGEILTGSIERTAKDDFYLAHESGIDRVLVPYFAVTKLIDPATGEKIPFDTPEEPVSPPAQTAYPAPASAPATPGATARQASPQLVASRMPMMWLFAIGAIGLIWFMVSRSRK